MDADKNAPEPVTDFDNTNDMVDGLTGDADEPGKGFDTQDGRPDDEPELRLPLVDDVMPEREQDVDR